MFQHCAASCIYILRTFKDNVTIIQRNAILSLSWIATTAWILLLDLDMKWTGRSFIRALVIRDGEYVSCGMMLIASAAVRIYNPCGPLGVHGIRKLVGVHMVVCVRTMEG